MGTQAVQHAKQLILDRTPLGQKSTLSPRAQLLLLHIAMESGSGHGTYSEGLGKRARAMGYNVPEHIDLNTERSGELSTQQVRAVKAAVNAATKELLDHGLLTQTRRGQTGQTAEYALDFLDQE